MALSLAARFSGVVFPITVTMGNFFELLTRAIEELVGLGPAFDGARVATAWTVGHLILSEDFQQLSDELFLLIPGTGLCDSDTELAHRVHGAFETEPFHRHV